MKKRIEFILKVLVFIVVLGMCVVGVNSILVSKYVDDSNFPTSATYKGFYEMEKDSIDVIFLGSSRASCAFSPQELYNMYEIRSYNLGCEMQNVLVSYYWLKEALRFQSPKVVVLETGMIFPYRSDEPLNTSIECTRKAMDYMKWSEVKWQAVKDICSYDETQSWESYVLPNIQFHDRWQELSRNDFAQKDLYGNLKLKGQTVLPNFYHSWDNEGRFQVIKSEEEKMHTIMERYLDKMVQLCKEADVELILVSVPSAFDSVEKYNMIEKYSAENGLLFIDYNEVKMNEQIEYNYKIDNAEYHHVGINGTYKLAKHFGKILQNKYCINGIQDEQWEITKSYYEQIIEENNLRENYDVEKYFEILNDSKYSIFIAAQNVNIYNGIPLYIKDILSQFALNKELWREDAGNRYYAVINESEVAEKNHHAPIDTNGTLAQGKVQYSIQSDVEDSSIIIDGVQCSKQKEGLNIVVYSNVRNRVVDSITLSFENGIGIITR